MTRQDFASFLKGLCSYYGRTMDLADETTAAQVGLWFRVVQELPAEPLDWIALRIQQDCDFFPRNLPKTVRATGRCGSRNTRSARHRAPRTPARPARSAWAA